MMPNEPAYRKPMDGAGLQTLNAAFPNIAFVGIPVILAVTGKSGMVFAVIAVIISSLLQPPFALTLLASGSAEQQGQQGLSLLALSFDEMLLSMVGLEPRNIWVDKSAKRFTNEFVAFDFPFAANALRRVKYAWSIFDDTLKQRYMTKGIDVGLGVIIPPMTVVTKFDSLWQDAMTAGNTAVVKAGTLAELAKATSLPLAALQATLTEYNTGAAVNTDEAFGKDRRWLQPISMDGPFYALRITYAIVTTLGGIKVDDHLHALDANDLPIPGLYLTGNDAGGLVAADSYTVTAAPGTSFGFAVGSGRMAATDILARLKTIHAEAAE